VKCVVAAVYLSAMGLGKADDIRPGRTALIEYRYNKKEPVAMTGS